jgi:hypothetical protein
MPDPGLAAALAGTREAWERWWLDATDAERSQVGAGMRALHDQGTAAGGLGCCGTTSAYHRPWCHHGPYEHE